MHELVRENMLVTLTILVLGWLCVIAWEYARSARLERQQKRTERWLAAVSRAVKVKPPHELREEEAILRGPWDRHSATGFRRKV